MGSVSRWTSVLGTCVLGCGDPASEPTTLYVGLLPIVQPGLEHPVGYDREPVTFRMDDDDFTHCSCASGVASEGAWVPPASTKPPYPLAEPESFCSEESEYSVLHSWRTEVEPEAFRPLTTDPTDSKNFYATLRFGKECPPHATPVAKLIENEDTENQNGVEAAFGAELPNESQGDLLGNYTLLYFCFFQAAPRVEETMTEFPDLGFSYAVFHDFEGPQPDWVVSKRWQFSDDENSYNKNEYLLEDRDTMLAFMKLVENPSWEGASDTYFDLARVR